MSGVCSNVHLTTVSQGGLGGGQKPARSSDVGLGPTSQLSHSHRLFGASMRAGTGQALHEGVLAGPPPSALWAFVVL